MEVGKPVERLADARGREVLGERPVLADDALERAAGDELGHGVQALVLDAEAVVAHDAGVVEALEQRRDVLQLLEVRARQLPAAELLDGHGALVLDPRPRVRRPLEPYADDRGLLPGPRHDFVHFFGV